MGCCLSTHDRRPSASFSSDHKRAQLKPTDSGAPPASVDEETVKEVLSETPTCPKPRPRDRGAEYPVLARREKRPADEVSEEVSEVGSLSESFSTATNLTDDAEGHAKPRASNRSPAKPRGPAAKPRSLSSDIGCRGRGDHGNRSRASANSPARRSDRSPARVNPGGSLKMVQSREHGSFRAVTARSGRPDPGEKSGRRSRSPATGRAENRGVSAAGSTVGRTPSARRTNPSPGRARPRSTDGGNREARGGGKRMSSANESLENPLVSLECFIFL